MLITLILDYELSYVSEGLCQLVQLGNLMKATEILISRQFQIEH